MEDLLSPELTQVPAIKADTSAQAGKVLGVT